MYEIGGFFLNEGYLGFRWFLDLQWNVIMKYLRKLHFLWHNLRAYYDFLA